MLAYPKNIIFDYKTYKLYNQFMNKINKDWKEVKLGDIGVFLRGFGISKKDLSDSGTPAIRYGNIYTKYDFIIKNISSFTNSKGTELKKGDIIVSVLTGNGLKDPDNAIKISNAPIKVENNIEEIRKVIGL